MPVTLRKLPLILLVALVSILASCSRVATNSVSGKVVKIADGDTITILDAQHVQHKIRLKGIDAPERRQDFSEVSRGQLAGMLFGKQVWIEYEKIDRYGRLVGKVWVDGTDGCLEQLKAGLAWHYKKYEREQSPADRQLYADAEHMAHVQKRGLWRYPSPIPPWVYRQHISGSSDEVDLRDEPISAGPNLMNVSPSPNINSTVPPTSLAKPIYGIDGQGLIRGNKRSMIYHWPGCHDYDAIASHNRVPFQTREDAEEAGYRAARNCP